MDFFTGLSDFISAHWGEVLAIFGGGGSGVVLVSFICRLILIKVQAKSTKKINAPVVAKFEETSKLINDMEAKVKQVFNDSLVEYTNIIRAEFSDLMAQYQEVKQAIYKEVVNGNEEAQKLLAELETKTIEIKNKVEQIQAEEQPKEDVVEEQVEETPIEPEMTEKSQNTSKKIVVTKKYGE